MVHTIVINQYLNIIGINELLADLLYGDDDNSDAFDNDNTTVDDILIYA